MLAEEELVYKDDHISHSVYVTFNLDAAQSGERYAKFGRDIKLLVWTTTPWTLTANMVSYESLYFISLSLCRGLR